MFSLPKPRRSGRAASDAHRAGAGSRAATPMRLLIGHEVKRQAVLESGVQADLSGYVVAVVATDRRRQNGVQRDPFKISALPPPAIRP